MKKYLLARELGVEGSKEQLGAAWFTLATIHGDCIIDYTLRKIGADHRVSGPCFKIKLSKASLLLAFRCMVKGGAKSSLGFSGCHRNVHKLIFLCGAVLCIQVTWGEINPPGTYSKQFQLIRTVWRNQTGGKKEARESSKFVSDSIFKRCLNCTKDSDLFSWPNRCLDAALRNRSISMSFHFLTCKMVISVPTLQAVRIFQRENISKMPILFLGLFQLLKRFLFLSISHRNPGKFYFTPTERMYVQSS